MGKSNRWQLVPENRAEPGREGEGTVDSGQALDWYSRRAIRTIVPMATAPTDSPSPSSDRASRQHRLERPRSVADILTQFVLPLIGLCLLGFAGWYVWNTRPKSETTPPPLIPSRSPFARTLAGSGVVEAQSENIAVGSPTPGVVVEVLVTVGDSVTAGAPLFRLDDRELRGELAVRKAMASQARSELIRLEAEPRQEKIPPLVAGLNEARAALLTAADGRRRGEETFSQKATTEQDLIAKRDAEAYAQAAVDKAQAELNLAEAGSWEYDRDVSRAAVSRAEAEVQKMESDIDRLTISALTSGKVLQVNIRPGEFVGAPPGQPLVLLGDVDRLHIRVDIDEFEISRFDPAAVASASPRGGLQVAIPLSFVRVEPFVVPKKSLSGDNTERVDTRVLQVIYACQPQVQTPLFVGQQVDVFIEAPATPPNPPAAGVDRVK